jgi:hypothetical protein
MRSSFLYLFPLGILLLCSYLYFTTKQSPPTDPPVPPNQIIINAPDQPSGNDGVPNVPNEDVNVPIQNPTENSGVTTVPNTDVKPIEVPVVNLDPFSQNIFSARPPISQPGVAVIVEWRICRYFVSNIFNAINNLPANWIIQVFHGTQNQEFISNHPKLIPLLKIGKLKMTLLPENIRGLNPNEAKAQYNPLLLSHWFWDACLEETILIFQMDSRFCSNSPHFIESYLNYTYVGSPWNHGHPCWGNHVHVGNGGFSLRKKSIMKKVLEQRAEARQVISNTPELASACGDIDFAEDTIFAWGIHYMIKYKGVQGLSFPTKEVAKTFSQENLGNQDGYVQSLGVHQGNDHTANYIQWCPEIFDARQGCTPVPNYMERWRT